MKKISFNFLPIFLGKGRKENAVLSFAIIIHELERVPNMRFILDPHNRNRKKGPPRTLVPEVKSEKKDLFDFLPIFFGPGKKENAVLSFAIIVHELERVPNMRSILDCNNRNLKIRPPLTLVLKLKMKKISFDFLPIFLGKGRKENAVLSFAIIIHELERVPNMHFILDPHNRNRKKGPPLTLVPEAKSEENRLFMLLPMFFGPGKKENAVLSFAIIVHEVERVPNMHFILDRNNRNRKKGPPRTRVRNEQ